MRTTTLSLFFVLVAATPAAEVESRVLTTYVPQDTLETAVRTEGWTEIALNVKGGIRKGDVVRLWAGGSIDRGNGDGPGQNVAGPSGPDPAVPGVDAQKLALSTDLTHAFAVLVKTESTAATKCLPAGKPLEIKMTKDQEKLWLGFNDEKGRFLDNHLGKGRRHEHDPFWLRIEVVRIVVDQGRDFFPAAIAPAFVPRKL